MVTLAQSAWYIYIILVTDKRALQEGCTTFVRVQYNVGLFRCEVGQLSTTWSVGRSSTIPCK